MTKEQHFNQEDSQLVKSMDAEAATKTKLIEDNKILLDALKEIAVPYPETNNSDQDKILCEYLIGRAQDAIKKVT